MAFNSSEKHAFEQVFASISGNLKTVDVGQLGSLCTKAGFSLLQIQNQLSSQNNDLTHVSFNDFFIAASFLKGAASSSDKITLHGHNENITHTINEDEKHGFVSHINSQLHGDKQLKCLPINPDSMQIFEACKDGILLAKLINDAVPFTIDERVLNYSTSPFKIAENNNLVINSAKAIGCSVVNIGGNDIKDGREHLVLGLVWQIIKIGLSARVNLNYCPELFRLLEPGETIEDFLKLSPEKILIRWFNYHLAKANWPNRVKNFSSDVKDGENYTVLLNQLAPSQCSRSPLSEKNILARAEMVLSNADNINCRKYLTPKTMVEGNSKLNFAFVANLFNKLPGLEPLSETEKSQIDTGLFDSEGTREARAFTLWLNSLGVDPFVNNLFEDLKDGWVLSCAFDKIQPGIVDWKKVNKPPLTSRFKMVENNNYVIVLGKSIKFTLVGIQGSDLVDGVKILTLGLVWQMMREHIIQTLKVLAKNGKDVTDNDIIKWANSIVKSGGKNTAMQSFKDSSLKTGVFLIDLLNGMKPGIVDYALVTNGLSPDNAKMNAMYAISIARKVGATIFVLPEDIIEVRAKMIMTFVGSLMALGAV